MEQSNADRFMYIGELNRETRSFRFERSSCVVDGCDDKPINSHLIPTEVSFVTGITGTTGVKS